MKDTDGRQYEQKVGRLRTENAEFLAGFRAWLQATGLKPKTVQRHLGNVEFYVDRFLAEAEEVAARDGAERVSYFLGYWFIRKALWASESSIRQNAASLKKFYVFLETKGLVSADDVQKLKDTVKEGMPEWVATLERYDDPEIDDPNEIWEPLNETWPVPAERSDDPTRERASGKDVHAMTHRTSDAEGQGRCLLEDRSFADLVRSDPELSSLRREHEAMDARERRGAADWAYTAGSVAEVFDAMSGQAPRGSPWFAELASLAMDPEYAPALLSVGSLEYHYGRVDEAMALFLRLTALPAETEDLAEIIDKAGDFLTDREDFDNARGLYEAAVAAHPREVVYHTGLSYCAGKTGRFEDAVEHSRRAIDLAPEDRDAWNDLGYSLTEVGRYDEAEAVLQRAVALDPQDVGLARGNLAHLKAMRRKAGDRGLAKP